jgi:hypothetical protein
MGRPIYVERHINATLDYVWSATQTPEEHVLWDLRFTGIRYAPRPDPSAPQRFDYSTRLGFGIAIEGWGETAGSFESPTRRSSALKFGSDDPKSLIAEGSGYWKYEQTRDGVRFLTLYDYRARYGAIGRLIDACVFRPVISWATAWSFDRLGLWLERGIDPAAAAHRALSDALARVSLAAVWIYQGVIPKLLLRHDAEMALIREFEFGRGREHAVLIAVGVLEAALGLLVLGAWGRRWPYVLSAVFVVGVTLPALFVSPPLFVAPFNPTTLVLSMLALCMIGWASCRDLPSARRCIRSVPRGAA